MRRGFIFKSVIWTLLLASILTTEAVEDWNRVVVAYSSVGASVTTDSDELPSIVLPQVSHSEPTHTVIRKQCAVASDGDGEVVDIPLWTFSHSPVVAAPPSFFELTAAISPLSFEIETRGPPVSSAQESPPTLRGPPVA